MKTMDEKIDYQDERALKKYYLAMEVLKMQKRSKQLIKTHQIKKLKKEIARILTEKNRK